MKNSNVLQIGGQCIITSLFRTHYNFYNKSLPFDYLRTTLSCVIKNIKNNFIDYIPNKKRCDYMVDKIKLFIFEDHAFYNHDITLDTINDSFKRRYERFNNILFENNNLILFRVITSKYISDELKLKDELYNCIKEKNSNIDLKIVFIGHRNDNNFEDIYFKNIDENSFLFTCGYKFRLEDNYTLFYKSCIDFIETNGFLYNNLKINLNTLNYIIDNNISFEDDINFYYLDNYYDIVPKNIINNELILCDDEFYKLYPDFNINFFKAYNADFKLFDESEIKNYFHLYGKNNNMVYNAKSFSNYYFNNDRDYNDENIKIFYESEILINIVKNKKNKNEKINIFLFTNCQGHHISAVLQKINIFKNYFSGICIRNYCERNSHEENMFNNINNFCDIFIYQPITSAHFNNTEKILNNLDPHILKISMPYTFCNWLWLFSSNIPNTMNLIKDFIIKEKLDNIVMDNKISNDILANNLIDFDILSRMNQSMNILKDKESITDIKTSDYILENYKNQRLFFTENHLAPPLVFHIFKQLLNLLQINILVSQDIKLGVYNKMTFYPISQYIQNILGLNYSDNEGNIFYINYFKDYCNSIGEEEINKKYNLNENNEIYV